MCYPTPSFADESEQSLEEILSSAESLFKAMQEKNHPMIWAHLSETSRATIVNESMKAIEKTTGRKIPEMDLRRDFEEGGPVSNGYWNGFLANFDPADALERSRWEKGRIEKDRAELLLTYRTSEKPALLKLFREKEGWKVGLVESFWGRK